MNINGVDRLGRTKAGDRAFVHNYMMNVCIPLCPCVKQARSLFLRLSCSAKGGEGIDLQTRLIVNGEQESKRGRMQLVHSRSSCSESTELKNNRRGDRARVSCRSSHTVYRKPFPTSTL